MHCSRRGGVLRISKRQTKKYTATASLSFNINPLNQQIAGISASSSSSNLLAQEASNVELVRLGDTATKTASLLGHGLTGGTVSESVSAAGKGESGVVSVSAIATSPVLAAQIANTYTREFVKEQQSANRQFFKAALTLVNRQLAELTRPKGLARTGFTSRTVRRRSICSRVCNTVTSRSLRKR